MSKKQFQASYPEAARFLAYLQDPANDTKKTIEKMPAWKKHFLSGYGVAVGYQVQVH